LGPLTRRQFLAAAAGTAATVVAAPALVGLARKSPRPLAGGFVEDWSGRGHALRDGAAAPTIRRTERVPVVIVGAGVAGLSAAWQLERRGMRDFVVLELAGEAGGNARAGENAVSRFPWAAHYVPVPGREAGLVRELFADLGVLGAGGAWDERALCFAPRERLFLHGEWHAGLEPEFALAAWERAEFRRFADLVAEHRASREFTIPSSLGRARLTRGAGLDRRSAATWLGDEGFRSPALRWFVDDGCRDDYGAGLGDTSAWAAAHYFAAREPEEEGPLTWPEGNAWIVGRLLGRLAPYVRTSAPVRRVERAGSSGGRRVRVLAGDAEYLADAVIFAAPTFLAPFIVEDAPPAAGLTYSPWLTANLTLDRAPAERGAPLAWDNVLYDSPALGYVVATHQRLRAQDDGASVWTYYWALGDRTPNEGRRLLARRPWHEWAAAVIADLERAHPDLRQCVARVDVLRMGHAMARPTPGFLTAAGRLAYAGARGPVVYANSDLSGLSLFEEAQECGVRAAERAMAWLGGGVGRA
jgi:glycine/D-amino acid oxidase-like deaminating enzyme